VIRYPQLGGDLWMVFGADERDPGCFGAID
jgi:hypothetical protein